MMRKSDSLIHKFKIPETTNVVTVSIRTSIYARVWVTYCWSATVYKINEHSFPLHLMNYSNYLAIALNKIANGMMLHIDAIFIFIHSFVSFNFLMLLVAALLIAQFMWRLRQILIITSNYPPFISNNLISIWFFLRGRMLGCWNS